MITLVEQYPDKLDVVSALEKITVHPTKKSKNARFRACVQTVLQLFSRDDEGRVIKDCKPLREKAWVEFFDPLHRRPHELKVIFALWQKQFQPTVSFWEFLRTHQTPNLLSSDIQIDFLDSKERQAFRANLAPNEEGKPILVGLDGRAFLDNTYMFVLGPDDLLYVGIEKRGKFHHSSFFSGKSVKCPGELIIKDGILQEANTRSGHYRPGEMEAENFRKFVQSLGIALTSFIFTLYEKDVT